MPNTAQTASSDPLARLLQKNQFVGWLGAADFVRALVLTSDVWKAQARGVPHNCFLLAAAVEAPEEILLLRVTGSAETPADAELQSKLEKLKSRAPASGGGLTVEEFQFGLLQCRVLGTFYLQDGRLRLGSDVENYAQAAGLAVYRPDGVALEAIVNYLSPARIAAAEEEARRLGLKGELPHFPIGTVRYASTERLHRGGQTARAVFNLNAVDFLARRTAVFGMTRTGKSNTGTAASPHNSRSSRWTASNSVMMRCAADCTMASINSPVSARPRPPHGICSRNISITSKAISSNHPPTRPWVVNARRWKSSGEPKPGAFFTWPRRRACLAKFQNISAKPDWLTIANGRGS